MDDDPPLFSVFIETPNMPRGHTREQLEEELAGVDAEELSLSGVAVLRMLADHLDALDVQLRHPKVKPYDRVPLVQLAAQYFEAKRDVFGDNAGGDGWADALAQFEAAAGAHDAARSDPTD